MISRSRFKRRLAHPQRGAALVLAVLVVALAVLLVDYLLSQYHALFRLVDVQQQQVQAQLILDGGVQFARRLLLEDANSSAQDTLNERWAIPLAVTPIQAANEQDYANVSGRIEDEQSRFNLRNLYVEQGQANESEWKALQRLFSLLGLNQKLTVQLHNALFQATDTNPLATSPTTPLTLTTLDDLRQVAGFEPDIIQRLRPHLTVLPKPTPLNANTASAILLAARIEALDLAGAERLVAARTLSPFRDLADISLRIPEKDLALKSDQISVNTQYFRIHAQVQYQAVKAWRTLIVARENNNTQIIWERAW